jgi:hypothetical protein
VTGGLAATAVSQREAAWQQILGQGELAEQGEFALAPASGLGTFRGSFHLNAIMHSETIESKSFFECENRTCFLSPTSSKVRFKFSKAYRVLLKSGPETAVYGYLCVYHWSHFATVPLTALSVGQIDAAQ